MKTDLETKFDAVCDEASFVAFLAALASDRADEVQKEKVTPSSPYGPGANGWENTSIEAFFESASAWASDYRDSSRYEAPLNIWKRCAEIIRAGKTYE